MARLLDGNDPDDVREAARLLSAGRLVAFPTETVYGLGANGLDDDAVRRAFLAKGRPSDNPVILHTSGLEAALALWAPSPEERRRAERCAAAFWPGPLTLVLPAAAQVPRSVTAGLDSVGVRVPDHDVARAVLDLVEVPLAAPSANASGRPSPTTAAHVLRTLGERIDAVLDGGPTAVGVESTVLDLRCAVPRVLRVGGVSVAQLRDVLGDVEVGVGDDDDAPSPGRRHRHYAPAGARVRLLAASDLDAAWGDAGEALLLCARTAHAAEARLGPARGALEVLPDDAAGFARALYAALYRLEGQPRIAIERPPDDAAWTVVRDRVARAADVVPHAPASE